MANQAPATTNPIDKLGELLGSTADDEEATESQTQSTASKSRQVNFVPAQTVIPQLRALSYRERSCAVEIQPTEAPTPLGDEIAMDRADTPVDDYEPSDYFSLAKTSIPTTLPPNDEWKEYADHPDEISELKQIDEALKKSLKDLDRRSIEKNAQRTDFISDALMGLSNEFARIACSDGDTFVYIGAHPMTKGEDKVDYDYVSRHFEQLHKMQSPNFKSLGSEKFDKMLGPMSIRTERRLRKEGVLNRVDTSDIKLYLDLRPPTEDEDAIILLTDLTCTFGVLSWHKAAPVFGISPDLICGKDAFRKLSDAYKLPSFRSGLEKGKAEKLSKDKNAVDGKDGQDIDAATADSLEPEYSALRHRSAIERLLQAIAGGDPRLDSAPKVWSYFAVAKFFGCAANPRVSDWIARWLLADPNLNFLQCNPEVALRIGMGIMSPDITRDTFSMLVGEKALLNVCGETDPSWLTPLIRSVHDRKLELLDEDERNRIDHAAVSLVQRIRILFASLVDEEMAWLEKSDEFMKFIKADARTYDEGADVHDMIKLIKTYIRGRIYWVLCAHYTGDNPDLRHDLSGLLGRCPVDHHKFSNVYNFLDQQRRLFTRTFWMALSQEQLNNGFENTSSNGWGLAKLAASGWSTRASEMQHEYSSNPLRGIKVIERKSLFLAATKFNEMQARHLAQDEKSYDLMELPVQSPKSFAINDSPESNQEDEILNFQLPVRSIKRKDRVQDSSSGDEDIPENIFEQNDDKLDWEPMAFTDANTSTTFQDLPAEHELRRGATTKIRKLSQETTPKELIRCMPSAPRDNRYERLSSSGKTRNGSEKGGDPNMPVKYFPTDSQHSPFGEVDPSDATAPSAFKTPNLGFYDAANVWKPGPTPFQPAPTKKRSEKFLWTDFNDGFSTDASRAAATAASASSDHCRYFNVSIMLEEFTTTLRKIAYEIAHPAHLFHDKYFTPVDLIDTLMCLDDAEWKFLPLWAGGNDDGTHGVFDEVFVPNLSKGGFLGGKRGIGNVDGTPVPSSVDSFSDVSTEAMSTVGHASRAATVGGGDTVISLSDDGASDVGFMEQDNLWQRLREMKDAQGLSSRVKGKGKAGEEFNVHMDHEDEDGDGDVSTVQGTVSDAQGEMFGDIDDDEGEGEVDMPEESEDSDIEIIDKHDL